MFLRRIIRKVIRIFTFSLTDDTKEMVEVLKGHRQIKEVKISRLKSWHQRITGYLILGEEKLKVSFSMLFSKEKGCILEIDKNFSDERNIFLDILKKQLDLEEYYTKSWKLPTKKNPMVLCIAFVKGFIAGIGSIYATVGSGYDQIMPIELEETVI